jgi:hypothetical protein
MEIARFALSDFHKFGKLKKKKIFEAGDFHLLHCQTRGPKMASGAGIVIL